MSDNAALIGGFVIIRYTVAMQDDIDKVLFGTDRIATRVAELGREIMDAYGERADSITIVPIMTGAMIFAADLIRQLPARLKINLMTVSSYPGASIRTQGSKILEQQLGDVHGRHVLLIDDILDSGGTLKLVIPTLKKLGAADVHTCVLLRKDRETAREVEVDFVGFDIPDEFVIGYGLDYDNLYRNLPSICTLKKEVYAPEAAVTP